MASNNAIFVILLLAFFGLLTAIAIGIFTYSVIQQRRYDRTVLPDLGLGQVQEEEYVDPDDVDEVVNDYRFAKSDSAGYVLDDNETNTVIKEINKASGEEAESPSSFSNFFKKSSKAE